MGLVTTVFTQIQEVVNVNRVPQALTMTKKLHNHVLPAQMDSLHPKKAVQVAQSVTQVGHYFLDISNGICCIAYKMFQHPLTLYHHMYKT